MPIDIKQVLGTFVEETYEMLQSMESALLAIEINNPDPEKINLMFRVMHSIKSGSAIFGFNKISEFAHTLETLLQKIRSGEHTLTQTDVNLFFTSVDFLRSGIENIINNKPINDSVIKELSAKVKESLEEDVASEVQKKPVLTEVKATTVAPPATWEIKFKPLDTFLVLGNTPFRAFKALKELGKCEIKLDVSQLPDLENLDPTKCYIKWDIILDGKISVEKIKDIFLWITEENTIDVNPVANKEKIEKINRVPEKVMPVEKVEQKPQKIAEAIKSLGPSIRVSTEKIDSLMNIIGELVITQSMIMNAVDHFREGRLDEIYESISKLERNSRELQETALRMRMVPVDFVFNRFPRSIHDIATKMKKEVELIISGENTELDKLVMEKISDPLLHLIRNAVDHGIELPHIRQKKGKPAAGKIELNAYQEGGNIIIDIIDDGAGMDKAKIRSAAIEKGLIGENVELTTEQIYQIIFLPGFSTAKSITDISGRGVGLDIVNKSIMEVGGTIDIHSTKDVGTIFSLRLPLTLAIMDCQLVRVGRQIYILPLNNIIELLKMDPEDTNRVDESSQLYNLRGQYIPLIYLEKVLYIPSEPLSENTDSKSLAVIEHSGNLYGLVCDELLTQQPVVIKNIENNYQKIKGISGATILGNGKISLIIDVTGVVAAAFGTAEMNRVVTEDMSQENYPALIKPVTDPDKVMEILIFLLENQQYAVDMLKVIHLQKWEDMTLLPNAPHYVKGVINLRGNVVPVIDLCDRLNLSHEMKHENSAIIAINIEQGNKNKIIGIMADTVNYAYTTIYREIKPIPDNKQSDVSKFADGLVTVENKMVTILNLDEIFYFNEM